MGKYKSMMQALAPRPDDIPKSESDAVYYRLGFNQAREAAGLLAEDADALDEHVIRLSRERDEARAEVDLLKRKRAGAEMDVERLTKERDEARAACAALEDRSRQIEDLAAMERMTSENNEEIVKILSDGRKQDAKELARLRSIIRQMIREEAEREIEALGVGEEGQ